MGDAAKLQAWSTESLIRVLSILHPTTQQAFGVAHRLSDVLNLRLLSNGRPLLQDEAARGINQVLQATAD